jgi:uncharacterized protein YdaU (DUF1376 family)
MKRNKRPSYPRYYKDYLSDYKVMAMTLEEEGMYNRLMDFCWDQGSLPNESRFLASMCKGASPTDLVMSCFVLVGDQYHHEKLDEIRNELDEFKQLQSEYGKLGNEARWHNKQKNKRMGRVSPADRNPIADGDALAIEKNRIASSIASASANKENLAAPQASPPDQNSSGPVPPKERPKDEAFERFATEFLQIRGIPYRTRNGKDGDFVQLALLRRQLQIGTRDVPQRWDVAIQNYLASPLTTYTLADLCVRYDVFVLGAVDRFNRPAESKEQISGGNSHAKSGQNSGSYRPGEGKPGYVPKQRGLSGM